MAERVDDEREARIVLTAVSEPGNIIAESLTAISGASVVVKAVRRSGSLSTVRFSDASGRAACASRGPVARQASAGCHSFLQERIVNFVVDIQDLTKVLDSNGGLSRDRAFAHSFTRRSCPELKL